MHELGPGSQPPERSGTQLVCRPLTSVLYDSIAGPYVVEEKIAERVNDLVTKRRRHDKRSPVNRSSRWRCGDGGNVTQYTAKSRKQEGPRLRLRRRAQHGVTWWHHRGPHELSKQGCVFPVIFRIGHVIE